MNDRLNYWRVVVRQRNRNAGKPEMSDSAADKEARRLKREYDKLMDKQKKERRK